MGGHAARPRLTPVVGIEPAAGLRVLLVAGHPIVRSSLVRLLSDRDDLDIVAEAADPAACRRLAFELEPEAILFAAGRAADQITEIAQVAAELVIPVVLVGDETEVDFAALTAAGISGYLLPDAGAAQIAAALQAVTTGLLVSGAPPPPVTAETGPVDTRARADDPLTDREMQVLQLVARGLPNKGIARRLSISEHTVKFHVGSILSKLGVASRTEAVTQAAHRGLLTL